MAPPKDNLRSGYTTGACAAAAARGALLALIQQRAFADSVIRLPQGHVVTFALHHCEFNADTGFASVIKDAGDDPDVTDKAEICARVCWQDEPGIVFQRGPGVGLVTRPGLPVPPGEPAINPVPRQMIAAAVQEVLDDTGVDRGVCVEVSVPGGEEIAKKTFNPRLGIVGGISILGTTGIVVPYSTEAWLASVVQGIDVAVAQGCRHLILTVGARGEKAAQALYPQLPEVAFIQIGPFFGDALRHCAAAGVEHVSLVGMIGKLAKFAAGHESVHSSVSRQDFAFLAEVVRAAGGVEELTRLILAANTAQEVAELVLARGRTEFFSQLCSHAWHFAKKIMGTVLALEVLLTGIDGEILGRCSGPDR
jgi:cobalt-precorrin-5B (C1)-methyltransferase